MFKIYSDFLSATIICREDEKDLFSMLLLLRFMWQNIRIEVSKYGPIEMRSARKTNVRIFSVWIEQLVNESFIV